MIEITFIYDIYNETMGGVYDDSMLKITGAIKDADLAIKKIKKEDYPKVAKTHAAIRPRISYSSLNGKTIEEVTGLSFKKWG